MIRSLSVLTLAHVAAMCHFAVAQTNDHLYRSWRWSSEVGSPRALGLGGAFVAVADDAAATVLNPAGLTLLPQTELAGSLMQRGAGSVGRDTVAARSGIGFAGGAGLLTRRWAIGGYLVEPRAVHLTLVGARLPDGSVDEGRLEATVTDVGASAAWNISGRVHLGFRVTATHLRLEGEQSQSLSSGARNLRVGTSAGDTRVTGSLGVLYDAGHGVRFGFLLAPGASWGVERTATNPRLGLVLDGGSEYEVRAPGVASGAMSVRLSEHLLVTGQVDYVRYSELRSSLAIRQGSFSRQDYQLDDALEPRLGAEASWTLGSVAVQLRAGLHSEAPGALWYRGSEASESATFTGSERRWLPAAGASIVMRRMGLHAATRFGGDRNATVFGVAVRL